MQQQFIHILTILFKHEYFSDKNFKSINVTYEKDTSRFLRNLNIIIKSFPGGVHLLTTEPDLLNTPDETSAISLLLNCNDSLFFNYTELSAYRPSDNILYFNNLNTNSKTNDNSYPLNKNKFVTQDEVIPVVKGKITIPNFESGKKHGFSDAAGIEISSQNIHPISPESGDFYISSLNDGIINIIEGKKEVGKVYNYTNDVWKKPMGILEIFTGKLYKHFKENGKVNYTINFNNRQTIWKYFLVDPVYQKFKNLTIINKSKDQAFKTPVKKTFHEEMEALMFESINKIPISELSNNYFQLVDRYDPKLKAGKVIIKNLANASPELLYHDGTKSSETIYSHIFI